MRTWKAVLAVTDTPRRTDLPHPDDGHKHWYACVRCGVDNGINEAATGPRDEGGTLTRCALDGVHEHAFRGPHVFREWEPST